MGKEFEAKVLLTPDEYINILEQEVVESGIKKSDIYYSKYSSTEEALKNGESLTRIRTEADKAYLTLKKKELVNGFENNKEYETRLEDAEVVKNFYWKQDILLISRNIKHHIQYIYIFQRC